MLLCFGDIEVDRHWADRDPPDTEEQRRARVLLKITLEERKKAEDERKKKADAGIVKTMTEIEKEAADQERAEEDARIAEM